MPLSLSFAARSDVGQERDENQDAYGFAESESLWLFTVCDGLGGYAGGATASRMAVSALESRVPSDEGPLRDRMERAIQRANRLIHEKAQTDPTCRKMATTVALFVVDADEEVAHIAHVGDSRIYRMRGNAFTLLTRDHTFVQRLVDDGILTPEAAANHPQGNVISRSVGGESKVDIEHGEAPLPLEAGDIYVLCSDGLHGLVSDEEIARTVLAHPPKDAARILVDRANEEGGHDNITVQVVAVEPRPAAPPEDIEVVLPKPLRHVAAASPGRVGPESASDVALADTDPRVSTPPPVPEIEESEDDPALAFGDTVEVETAKERPRAADADDADRGVSGAFVMSALVAFIVVVAIGLALLAWSVRDTVPAPMVAPGEGSGSGEGSAQLAEPDPA